MVTLSDQERVLQKTRLANQILDNLRKAGTDTIEQLLKICALMGGLDEEAAAILALETVNREQPDVLDHWVRLLYRVTDIRGVGDQYGTITDIEYTIEREE